MMTWPQQAIWALDHWLRERQGIYEFTDRADCLFRIQRERAEQSFTFFDGTCVRAGDPIIGLHLWNEHIPAMGRKGPTLAWARRTLRALDTSLYDLAHFLHRREEYAGVRALYGNMCLGTAAQCEQLGRIVQAYGFEVLCNRESGFGGSLHLFGQGILTALLALATNPATLRTAVLRRYREHLILSRAALEARYAAKLARVRRASDAAALNADSRSERKPDVRQPCSAARQPERLPH